MTTQEGVKRHGERVARAADRPAPALADLEQEER